MELRRPRRHTVPDAADTAGKYYASVSRKMALVKWLLIVALPIFLVVMLAAYHSNITYDNLTYLLKDFQSDRSGISSDFSDITFESQSVVGSAIFKGELAIVGSNDITLYNSTGEKTFDYRSGMANPVAEATDKYLFCYDLGGTHYSIFTNLARVLDAQADSVIENASMAKDGSFLIVTRAGDAKYTVALYDSSFKNRANYKRSRFVSDAAISPDGDRLAIVTVANSGASLSTVVELYEFGATECAASFEGTDFLPISLEYFDDGGFALLCDTRIIFFDRDGNEVSTYLPEKGRLTCADAKGSSVCAVYSDSVTGFESDVVVFDSRGAVSFSLETEHKISDVSHSDGYVFALAADGVHRFDRTTGSAEFAPCDPDVRRVVAVSSFAIAVTQNGASCVFGDAEEAVQS